MGSQIDTQRLITQTIGLSETTFNHSCFARQGAVHFASPDLAPRQRKDVLTDALGLEVWETLRDMVRVDITALDRELEALAAKTSAFEDDLLRKEEIQAGHVTYVATAALCARGLAEAEVTEERARAELARVKGVADRVEVLTAQRSAAAQTVAGLEAKLETARTASAKVDALLAEVERLTPLAARVESLEREGQRLASAAMAREAALAKQTSLKDRLTALEELAKERSAAAAGPLARAKVLRETPPSERCDKCGQDLHGEALARAKASAAREAEELERQGREIGERVRQLGVEAQTLREELVVGSPIPPEVDPQAEEVNRVSLQVARDAVFEMAAHQATVAQLRESLAEVQAPGFERVVEESRVALARIDAEIQITASPTPETLQVLEGAVSQTGAELALARNADRQAQTALAASEERLKHLAELEGRSQEALAEKTRLAARLTVLKALERSYGRDGIPVLLLETLAIPQVETEARRVLEALGMPFRVELVTQRENKGGGLKDTLDVVVHEPAGPRAYATFSGGERSRIEVALRIALARLIAQRSSSHCSLLALDEISFLDRSGQTALVEVLRSLTEFSSIVVVSHDEVMSEGFDQQVVVIRDEAGSRLEDAA